MSVRTAPLSIVAGESMDSLSTGYAVTIVVEGGLGSLEVLKNDIDEGRPIVLIQVRRLFSVSMDVCHI